MTFLHIFVPSDLCCVNWSFSILSCLCYQPLTLQHIPTLSGNNRLFDNLKLKFDKILLSLSKYWILWMNLISYAAPNYNQ